MLTFPLFILCVSRITSIAPIFKLKGRTMLCIVRRFCIWSAITSTCASIVIYPATNSYAAGNPRSSSVRHNGNLASRIVWAGEHVGGREGTVGFCLKGVEDSLEAIGIHLPRLSYARQMGRVFAADKRQFREINVRARLRPGDIIVHGGARANPDGHIAIVLPGELESSDHIQRIISPLNPAFGKSRVFEPIA